MSTQNKDSSNFQDKIDASIQEFKLNALENNSTLFIILITLLLLTDYYSLYQYDIELKNFKYLISDKELLFINYTIISILGLFAIIVRRIPMIFLSIFTILLAFNLDYNNENQKIIDSVIENFTYAFICGVIVLYTLNNKKPTPINQEESFLDTIINFPYKISSLSNIYIRLFINTFFFFLIFLFLYMHFESNLNHKWNYINYQEGKYNFEKDSIIKTFFNQKLFTTNKLEKLQNDIEFINSELFVKELIDKKILKNNTLNYKDFYVHYLPNDKYQSFFVIIDKNLDKNTNTNLNENIYGYHLYQDLNSNTIYENTNNQKNVFLYIILTQKYDIDKFQIIDIIGKELKVNDKT